MIIVNTLSQGNLDTFAAIRKYWNSELLEELYFSPKKVPEEQKGRALADAGMRQQIQHLGMFLAGTDAESACREILHAFEQDTGFRTGDEKLFLILGCGTTTIYSIQYQGEPVYVLCLESVRGNKDRLRMLLAHEYTHLIRAALLRKDIFESCLGERLVTEEIAENYSAETVPGMQDRDYCIVEDAAAAWVLAHREDLRDMTKGHLEDASWIQNLFSMSAEIDFPVRTGYVYGYYAVRDYLLRKRLRVKDILGADWKEILKEEEA